MFACVFVCAYVSVCMCVCVNIYIYMCVCVCVCINVGMYIHMNTPVNVHTVQCLSIAMPELHPEPV